MLTAVLIFLNIFTYCFRSFCSHIGVNVMKFYTSVVQTRGLAYLKPGLIHHFLHMKITVIYVRYNIDSCYPFD